MESHVWQVRRLAFHASIALALVSATCVTSVAAQTYAGWTLEKLASAWANLIPLPNEERLSRHTEIFSRYLLDQAWPLTAGNGNGGPEPKVEVHTSDAPAQVAAGIIAIPQMFSLQMEALGLLVGHDAALLDGESAGKMPILWRPYGEGELLQIMPGVGDILEPDRFLATGLTTLAAACGADRPSCRNAQFAALLCTSLFVVAHEATHVRRGHKPRNPWAYRLDEELQADAGGIKAVQRYLRNLRAEAKMTATSETIACLAGPVAFFELNLRRSLSNQQRLDYNQRKRAVLDATGEYRHDIDDLVTLRSKDGGGGSISIEWSDPPDMVVLDGVQVDISGLKGLVLPSGLHKIVAAGDAGIAVHNVRVSHGRVTKIYLPLRSYIQLSSKDLAAAVQERRWSDVLRATSNGVLRPRSVRLARAHWDALYGLGLSAWIDSSDIVAVGGKEGKKALTLRTIGEPLFDWDADLVRKAMNRCCD